MKNSSTPWIGMLPMKGQQVTTSLNGSSDRVKSSEDIQLLQNKFTPKYRSISETFKEDYEEEESAREDPTIDEYHNMTRKEEDDSGGPKSTNESMRINPFADFPNHAELEQQADCSRFQLMQVRDGTCFDEEYYPTKFL